MLAFLNRKRRGTLPAVERVDTSFQMFPLARLIRGRDAFVFEKIRGDVGNSCSIVQCIFRNPEPYLGTFNGRVL